MVESLDTADLDPAFRVFLLQPHDLLFLLLQKVSELLVGMITFILAPLQHSPYSLVFLRQGGLRIGELFDFDLIGRKLIPHLVELLLVFDSTGVEGCLKGANLL